MTAQFAVASQRKISSGQRGISQGMASARSRRVSSRSLEERNRFSRRLKDVAVAEGGKELRREHEEREEDRSRGGRAPTNLEHRVISATYAAVFKKTDKSKPRPAGNPRRKTFWRPLGRDVPRMTDNLSRLRINTGPFYRLRPSR